MCQITLRIMRQSSCKNTYRTCLFLNFHDFWSLCTLCTLALVLGTVNTSDVSHFWWKDFASIFCRRLSVIQKTDCRFMFISGNYGWKFIRIWMASINSISSHQFKTFYIKVTKFNVIHVFMLQRNMIKYMRVSYHQM